MPKRNRNRNGNYFKTKIVAYWPVVSAKVQYSLFEKLGQAETSTPSPAARTSASAAASVQSQIEQYLAEVKRPQSDEDALSFRTRRQASYPLLAPLAEDLITAPASQAYVERIFSVCGWFTAGRRNRLSKNLEMRVFLKLNKGWTKTFTI